MLKKWPSIIFCSFIMLFLILTPSEILASTSAGSMISGEGRNTVAIKTDGTAWYWGYNLYGTFGDLTNSREKVPVQVDDLNNIVSISTGGRHALALSSDGTVWAWGNPGHGKIGNDSVPIYHTVKTPIQVMGLDGEGFLDDVVEVSAGPDHSLALKADGTVWAWGNNWYGQLGDGTRHTRSTPVKVRGIEQVQEISAGNSYSMAVRSDGTVWAWGANGSGKLGDGSKTRRTIPTRVVNLSSVESVSAGFNHSLALKSDGTVWAWGSNEEGQLGDGDGGSFGAGNTEPVRVEKLSRVEMISAGTKYSLALKSDGTVWSWGSREEGALGHEITQLLMPERINGLEKIVSVSAGKKHSLALQSNGNLWAWGLNTYGKLGDGTASDRDKPVQSMINLGEVKPPADSSTSTPSLTLPVHGEIVHGPSVILEWDPAEGATHYAVWIYNLTRDELVLFEVVGESTSFTYDGLADNGDIYAWSVVANNIDDGTWGDFAIPIAFIDGSDADLLPPTLISPEHNANVTGASVEFEWKTSAGATHYALWLYNLTADELVLFEVFGEGTSFTYDGLAENGDIYAWSIVSSNINDQSWSDFAFPRTFVTKGDEVEPSDEWVMPIKDYYLIQDYGNFRANVGYHTGLDIRDVNENIVEVYTIADGVVEKTYPVSPIDEWPYWEGGYGSAGDNWRMQNIVIVKHELSDGETVYSLYCHMRNIKVEEGEAVQAGETVLGETYVRRQDGNYNRHVHLELKTEPVVHAPTGEHHYGYTPEHPSNYGYLNPWDYLD